MDAWSDMNRALDDLRTAGLFRQPAVVNSPCAARVTVDGREVLCLCSNDYLGLANHPAVKNAVIQAVQTWGVGAGASRLVSGTSSPHVQLEAALAQFKNTQAALVAPTGYMANRVAIHALAGAGDLVLCDKLNHASIIDAALSCDARVRTYPHRDVQRLEELLRKHRAEHKRCLIVTDTLFSMDGDLAPLRELADLKARYDALLLIDEAHATGVLGEGGKGAAEMLGVEHHIDATVGTLSKALGGLGGFVAGPQALIDTIRNTGRAFMFTTALPPALCTGAMESLRIVRDEPERRNAVLALAAELRRRLAGMGLNTGGSVSQIIPIIIGQASQAVKVSRDLLEAGFLVPAIRPPTVPKGTSRLRVSLSAEHAPADIEAFLSALKAMV